MPKKEKKQLERYIIRKYIFASSAKDAMKKDKITPIHDVWLDEKYADMRNAQLTSSIGFAMIKEDE